jgi:hypothetical protein
VIVLKDGEKYPFMSMGAEGLHGSMEQGRADPLPFVVAADIERFELRRALGTRRDLGGERQLGIGEKKAAVFADQEDPVGAFEFPSESLGGIGAQDMIRKRPGNAIVRISIEPDFDRKGREGCKVSSCSEADGTGQIRQREISENQVGVKSAT